MAPAAQCEGGERALKSQQLQALWPWAVGLSMRLGAPLTWIRALSRGSIQRLSVKSKLILMLLPLASGFSPLVTARPGYRSDQENLSKRVFNPLTSVRASKAY